MSIYMLKVYVQYVTLLLQKLHKLGGSILQVDELLLAGGTHLVERLSQRDFYTQRANCFRVDHAQQVHSFLDGALLSEVGNTNGSLKRETVDIWNGQF